MNCCYFHSRNEIIVFAKSGNKNFLHRYWSEEVSNGANNGGGNYDYNSSSGNNANNR